MIDQPAQTEITLRVKLTITIFALAICIISALYTVPYFVDADKYSQALVEEVSKLTSRKVSISEGSGISVNPFLNKLELSVNDFIIKSSNNQDDSSKSKDLVYIKTLSVSIKLTDIFAGKKYNLNSILIDKAYIDIDSSKDELSINDILTKIKSQSSKLYFVEYFNVKNSTLNYRDTYNVLNFTKLNLDLNNKRNGSIEIKTEAFDNNQKMISISAFIDASSKENSRPFKMNVSHNKSIYNILGNFLEVEERQEFVGSVDSKIVEPSILGKEIIIALPFLKPMLKDKLDAPLDIKADLYITANDFNFRNINISSVGTNAKGQMGFSRGDQSIYCELSFENFNFDNFFDFTKKEKEDGSLKEELFYEYNAEDNKFIDLLFLDKIQFSLKIDSKNTTIKDLLVQDVMLNIEISHGELKKGEASFNMNNKGYNSRLELTNLKLGKVNDYNFIIGDLGYEGNNINDTLELFNLTKYISIDEKELDYKLYSKVLFAPQEISLFDIDGKLGKNGVFSGSIATKKEILTDYNFDIKFQNLKVTNFDMPLIKNRAKILLEKSTEDDYYSHFRWFRALNSTYNLRIELVNTEFKDEKISKLVNIVKLKPGAASFKGEVEADFLKVDYDVQLLAHEIIPELSVNIRGDNVDYGRLDKLFLGFIHPEGVEEDEDVPQDEVWSNKEFKLFKIQKFKSKFDMQLKNVQFAKKNIKDFNFVGYTSGDVFYVENLYFDIFGGNIRTRGNISFFDDVLYQFSFSASNMDAKDLLADFTPNFKSIEGQTTIAGSFVTKGQNPMKIISSLNASGNFVSPKLTIYGIDADVLVDVALKRQHIEDNMALDSIDAALRNGDTNITAVNGEFVINNGLVKANNTSFRTRFSNASFVMSLDLKNMFMSSDSRFSFMPYNTKIPIIYSISQNGSLIKGLETGYDTSNLLNFVKKQYDIQPEVSEKQKVIEDTTSAEKDDHSSSEYIYYQLKKNKRKVSETQN